MRSNIGSEKVNNGKAVIYLKWLQTQEWASGGAVG
jgi:hypothetical protein